MTHSNVDKSTDTSIILNNNVDILVPSKVVKLMAGQKRATKIHTTASIKTLTRIFDGIMHKSPYSDERLVSSDAWKFMEVNNHEKEKFQTAIDDLGLSDFFSERCYKNIQIREQIDLVYASDSGFHLKKIVQPISSEDLEVILEASPKDLSAYIFERNSETSMYDINLKLPRSYFFETANMKKFDFTTIHELIEKFRGVWMGENVLETFKANFFRISDGHEDTQGHWDEFTKNSEFICGNYMIKPDIKFKITQAELEKDIGLLCIAVPSFWIGWWTANSVKALEETLEKLLPDQFLEPLVHLMMLQQRNNFTTPVSNYGNIYCRNAFNAIESHFGLSILNRSVENFTAKAYEYLEIFGENQE